MTSLKDRVRKVDVSQMTQEQADNLSKQIGAELAKIMDEANKKCNEMLGIYGLQTQIHYKVTQLVEKTEEKPKKKSRSKKQSKIQSLDKTQTL